MSPFPSRTVLGITRLGVGVISLLAPRLAVRAFGADPNQANSWVTRLFGSRELVLAGLLLAADKQHVRQIALIGAAIDGLDAASSLTEIRKGNLSTYTAISGGGGAVFFAALGLDIARSEQGETQAD